MQEAAELPDLAALSSEQKDALITSLWRLAAEQKAELRSLEARLASDTATGACSDITPQQLLTELRRASPQRSGVRSRTKARLGRQLGFWRSKAVLTVVGLIGLAFAVNYGVSWYQRRAVEHRRSAELQLQHAALTGLYVELVRISYEPDGKSYRLVMSMRNINPTAPLYVMLNPVRVFEQSGLLWKEVPSRAPEDQSWSVVKLTDRYTYQAIFEPNVSGWTELMPGYMHVRIENDMLISRRSEPAEDIVERKNPYYVYLKPHGADDEAIRRRSKYSGQPPVYIPMPPH
jgi:hypothetical protein